VDLGPGGELRVGAGARVSSFAADAEDVPDIGEVSYTHAGLVGSASVQLVRPGVWNLYGAWAQGFRAPNLQETTVLGDTGSKFEIPNDDLSPERSDTFELGGRLARGPFEGSSAWFVSYLDGVIDEKRSTWMGMDAIDGKPVIQRVNASSGIYRGVETSVAVNAGALRLENGMAWLWGDITPEGGAVRPARRVPPFFGRTTLRWERPGRAWAEVFVEYAGRQDRLHPSDESDLRICETAPYSGMLERPCDGTPGWRTINARGGVRLGRRLRLDAAVLNVTDERYRLHGSGFDAPGIDVRLGISGVL
jgi:outer membrane receptor protein involved in Fe transport